MNNEEGLNHNIVNQKSSSRQSTRSIKIIENVHKNVTNQIVEGKLIVSQQQKPFSIKLKQNGNQVQVDEKIKLINERKNKIQRELEKIFKDEQHLKSSQVNDRKSEKTKIKYEKTELSAEDAQLLKKLVKQKKIFQKQLQQKSYRYQQKMKKFLEEEEALKRQKQEEIKQKKKADLQKKLQLMQTRRKQQQEKFEEQKKLLRQALQRKRAHEIMKDKWKQKEIQMAAEKQQLVEQMRRIRNVDYQEIKEHSKKYDQTIKAQRQSRVQLISPNTQNFYSSSFLDAVLQEKQSQKKQEQMKKLQLIELIQKKKAYGQQVRVNHKQSKKNENNISTLTREKQNQNKSLSFSQAHKKGVEYLRSANKNVSQHRKQPSKIVQKQQVRQKYKNYLQQLKNGAGEKRVKSEVEQIREIAHKNGLTDEERLYKAKMLTQKIESRNNNKNLVKSINAKLEFLRNIQY